MTMTMTMTMTMSLTMAMAMAMTMTMTMTMTMILNLTGNLTMTMTMMDPMNMFLFQLENILREMQDAETGVPVRSQKLFLTSIPAAFMGRPFPLHSSTLYSLVQCYFVPYWCVPQRKVSFDASLGCDVP